jgi:hypothetical protein
LEGWIDSWPKIIRVFSELIGMVGMTLQPSTGRFTPPVLATVKQKDKGRQQMNKTHLYVLWTNDNKVTAEKMVFMYTINSLLRGWWEKVTLIIWGAPAKLVSEDADIQEKIKEALEAGVHVTACKACADQLGVTETLEKLKIEVKYWGQPLTEILKSDERLLTI